MTVEEVKELFDQFNSLNALVIGDVMIDAYYHGKVDRISPEAPVPVVHVNKSDTRLGGAANVALNLKSLGANPILCSVVGKDNSGNKLLDLLNTEGLSTKGILQSKERTTTVKTRIISGSQQMLRIDEEVIENLSKKDLDTFSKQIEKIIEAENIDVVIFEDYDKGCINKNLIQSVVEFAQNRKIPVTVDPKKVNFLEYKNVDLFKPNLKELCEGLKIDIENKTVNELDDANKKLQSALKHKNALITLSEYGVFIGSNTESEIIPAHLRNIADVSGAGDTVISVASLCLAAGISNHWLAQFSNLAGGLVCEKIGVVPINKQSLLQECTQLCK